MKNNKIPPQAAINGLLLEDVPEELHNLTNLEKQLICLVIPFIQLIPMPRGALKLIKGCSVCIPIDLSQLQTIQSTSLEFAYFIKVKLKRKLEYKGHYLFETVDLFRVKEALHYLKLNNPHYADIEIKHEWLSQVVNQINTHSTIHNNENENISTITNAESTDEQEEAPGSSGITFPTSYMPEDLTEIPEIIESTLEEMFQIAPGENRKPISALEERAYPYLFPSGSFCFSSKDERISNCKLTAKKYFNQRILNKDNRFVKDRTYIFLAQYITEA